MQLRMDIKSADQIAKKWSEVTPQRAGDYEEGVKSPRRSWSSAAAGAEENYNTGVAEAQARGAFKKGVEAAGDEKWRNGAINKGVSRWPQGVRMGKSAYQTGFAPYQSVIAGLTLSPKGAKGDPRNYDRVREVGEALHSEKVGK